MKRRLRFIIALLAVCLLGSYGFQAYWLYGSYRLGQAQFARTAREALEAVVQRQQLSRANKVFNIKFNDYATPGTPPGRPRRWQIERLDVWSRNMVGRVSMKDTRIFSPFGANEFVGC